MEYVREDQVKCSPSGWDSALLLREGWLAVLLLPSACQHEHVF